MNTKLCRSGLLAATLAGGVSLAQGQELKADDETFWNIVRKNAKIEKLAGAMRFTEGPLWVAAKNELWFSDIPADRIVLWTMKPEGPMLATMRHPSSQSNGLTLDKQGRLIACEHANRRVSRTEPDGTIVTLAHRYEGKRLNSPNDVVVRSDGAIYFTDPPYGLPRQSEGKELDFNGVYRLSPDGKTLTLLVKDFNRPNGLAFSPDEKILYIADTAGGIRAFDVAEDGSLINDRMFAADHRGGDGMKVDVEGNLYATGDGAVVVYDPKGKRLGAIVPPEGPANCAFGDRDWKSLYMTARTGLYHIRVEIAGVKVP